MKKKFCIEAQEIGDIILVCNKAITSNLQRTGQALYTFKRANFSHAILALDKGMYIEAMKDKKTTHNITIFCIDELKNRLENEYEDNWKIIRLKNVNPTIQKQIKEAADYFYGQQYNTNPFYKKIHQKHNPKSSFCSELIQRIYEKVGIKIGHGNNDVWPIDLDLLTTNDSDQWINITDQYDQEYSPYFEEDFYLSNCQRSKELKNIIYAHSSNTIKNLNSIYQFNNYIETFINQINDTNIEKLDDKTYDALKKMIGSKEETFYSLFIKPIILKCKIEKQKQSEHTNLEINSYLKEELNFHQFDPTFDLSYKLLIEKHNQCKEYLDFVQIYFEQPKLFDNEHYSIFVKGLIEYLNNVHIYTEEDLSRSAKFLARIRIKYNIEETNPLYDILAKTIQNFRKINFIKNKNAISTIRMDEGILENLYKEYSMIK